MKIGVQDRLKQGLCILLLIGVSTASSSAQNSWQEAYQSPPDAVLRFQTDSNGKILPARVFGLDTLRGGAFSHSGTRFLMHSDSRILYTDFTNKTPLFTRETVGSKITSVSISPDDKILLTGYESGDFSAWFLDTGYPFLRHQGHSTEITATAFSSLGHAFATADDTGRFKIWSLNEAPRPILSGELGTEVKTLKFSPTGRLLLVGGPSSRVRVIEITTGEPLLELANEASYLITAEISKDETELFTAHRRNPTRRIWDLKTGDLKRELPTLNPSQNAYLDASIDRIATIESSGRMTFYSFSSGQQLHRQNVLPGNTSSFSLSPSGDYLFRQTNFGEIYRRKDDQKLMVLPNHIRHVRSLVISPDSTQLASSAGGLSTTRIQDLRTGQLLNTIAAAPAQIRFSPDSKYIYDARSGGKALARFDERLAGSDPSIVAVSITTDQHLVLQSFNQSPITVIDQTNGRTEKALQSSAGFENTQFTISPDHSLIGNRSQGGRIK